MKGLDVHHGVPLALDATLVSPLHADGTARTDGDTFDVAVRSK